MPLEGVTVSLNPAVSGVSITTDADGNLSCTSAGDDCDLPVGAYNLTFTAPNYTMQIKPASILAGQSTTVDAALVPVEPVVLDTSVEGTAEPGETLTASVTVTPLDGSTVQSIAWSQSNSVEVVIGSPNEAMTTVELPETAVFKDELFAVLGAPELERFMVQGLNPFQLEEAGLVTLIATVTTSSGAYTAQLPIHTELPWVVSPGLQDVPVGLLVLLQGKTLAAYDWALTEKPATSTATLSDATSRHPEFTPDLAGVYKVSVTDTSVEPPAVATLQINAGRWVGAITGQDADGRPLASQCTLCHTAGGIAPDKFPDWAHSGHAEIFTQNFNTNAHYSTACLVCHSVGYAPGVNNGGIDDASDYAAFLDTFTSDGVNFIADPNNWTNLLNMFPDVAQLTNAQCENCHGPNNTSLHANGTKDAARISISSDVCGACHGEPARHGRFQQWQESPHANYELALDEGTVESRGSTAGHCGRCHTGQGFLAWIQQDDLTQRIQGADGNATVAELTALGLTDATVHPQTCATCHDPHKQGTTSGEPNTATVRIMDNTPLLPAGFAALAVGRGAVCITCHNTRNGTHNDAAGLPTSYSAPHVAAQGDVLMGQNAYFVAIGNRSPHSYITDTCATCHMELTPPPPEFSFSGAGTNHTFRASLTICTECHGVFDGGTLQESTELELEGLAEVLSEYLMDRLTTAGTIFIKDYTPHTFDGTSYDVKSDAVQVDAADLTVVGPTEIHGQISFMVEFAAPVDVTYSPSGAPPHMLSLTQAQVQLGDFTTDAAGTSNVIATSDLLVRASWNYFLIHGDSSKGIHNPSFVFTAINEARAVLEDALQVEIPSE